eukprot:TRINITY_DN1006_c4_g1_i1.p4 TRINITY_DN1006_c4_g1~~TRINITY_DN1006_c4_g1_i1.p4  ORF type:complete len:114 (-),score=4.70 TRINITY_DN1006_c4_g1_i1:275-616(-)
MPIMQLIFILMLVKVGSKKTFLFKLCCFTCKNFFKQVRVILETFYFIKPVVMTIFYFYRSQTPKKRVFQRCYCQPLFKLVNIPQIVGAVQILQALLKCLVFQCLVLLQIEFQN